MLTALTADNQELFSLIDCSIDELTQIRSEQAFVCPMCHQSVILKAGPIKIHHFAHRKKNSCWYEAEAETEGAADQKFCGLQGDRRCKETAAAVDQKGSYDPGKDGACPG